MSEIRLALNDFLASVQTKALYQAEFSVKNRDEALDIVQDAMIRLAQKYSEQQENWPQLFQRILQNAILDWHRRKKVRSILVWWNQTGDGNETLEERVAIESDGGVCDGDKSLSPENMMKDEQINHKVAEALQQLPLRQQQAFMLRAWWGHDVEETAFAMKCSTGSVKTHYSRALQKLKSILDGVEL